jgi:hypothetical protein
MPDWRMWTLMLLPAAMAVVVLLARRRSLRPLLGIRLRGVWLIWVAAALQFLRITEPHGTVSVLRYHRGIVPVALIWALGVAFVAVNLRRRPTGVRIGLGLLASGFTLNSVAIAVNGGMPFSAWAARRAGFSEQFIAEASVRYVQTSRHTTLLLLADLIPVPGLKMVVSVGDLVMFVAISWVLLAIAWHGEAATGTRSGAVMSAEHGSAALLPDPKPA